MSRPELEPAHRLPCVLEPVPGEFWKTLWGVRGADPILDAPHADELEQMIDPEFPLAGHELDELLNVIGNVFVPHARRNAHPGFFGNICAPGLPTDPTAHAITAMLNQNVTSFGSSPSAVAVERIVVRWMAQLVGLPAGAEGILQSSGSLANFTAITIALHRFGGVELAMEGLAKTIARRGTLHLYVSEATHFSAQRAALLLGLGARNVRTVAVDRNDRMRIDVLRAKIRADRDDGGRPFCIVASAGTRSTGAIDPLREIAELCREEDIWLHVDAAYGGAALLAHELRPGLAGIELADSVCIDFHKWMYLAFDASILLVRSPEAMRRVFYASADYARLAPNTPPEKFAFFHRTLETSRRFRALPVWMALRRYGMERIGRNVFYNVECARYLAQLVEAHPDLELVRSPSLSICCFRYVSSATDLKSWAQDKINHGIRERLQREGEFYLSPTVVDGHEVLRVCIVNPATTAARIDALVEAVLRIGAEERARFQASHS